MFVLRGVNDVVKDLKSNSVKLGIEGKGIVKYDILKVGLVKISEFIFKFSDKLVFIVIKFVLSSFLVFDVSDVSKKV